MKKIIVYTYSSEKKRRWNILYCPIGKPLTELKAEGWCLTPKIRYLLRVLWIMLFLGWYIQSWGQDNPWGGFEGFASGQGARNAALNGSNGADPESELSGWAVNPAVLNARLWSNVALHSTFFPAGIRSFSLMGLVSRDSVWPVAAGFAYTSFGENVRYDAEGNAQGTFPAAVSQLSLGTSRQLWEDWHLGLSMHYDWRRIDLYRSHILRFDIGALYQADEYTAYGISLANAGYEIVPFHEERSSLPLDLSLYWQQKLRHLPFTFFLKMQKMNLWNRMTFDDPYDTGQDLIGGEEKTPSRLQSFGEELLRHMVLGGEFGFGSPEKVWLRFSYDHWKNEQLGIPAIRSLEGVALGFGLQLSVFRLDYTWERLYYNVGGHQLSLSFRLFEGDRRARGF